MLCQFGSIIVSASGSLGGHVVSPVKSVGVLRTKVTPTDPRSKAQMSCRSRFAELQKIWRNIFPEMRTAWNAAVLQFQTTDIFGTIKKPSGINLFQRLNNIRYLIGESLLDYPPTNQLIDYVLLQYISINITAQTFYIYFFPSIPARSVVIVSATNHGSPGRSNVKTGYKVVSILPAGSESGLDIAENYKSIFSDLGAPGKKTFLKFEVVDVASGLKAPAQFANCISIL
jgi:hypothetical protein